MSTVLLVLDNVEADRQSLAGILSDAATQVISVATPEEAVSVTNELTHVSAMIAAIPDVNGGSVFEFRDHLVKKFQGRVPTVFCSRNDMSAYYSRLNEGDKLFYKPVEIPVLKEWLFEAIGPLQVQAGSQPGQTGELLPIDSYEEALPVGIQIGDYKLERVIQQNNDFAIYEAEQMSIGRKVAIKTLYRKHRRDPVWVHAFVNEASARAKVDHPNVSLVYECIQELGVNFYTLELVDAPSVAELAAKNVATPDKVITGILESCLSALEYFRKNEMEHRLISSDMILLQDGEQTRIANPVKGIGAALSPSEELQQMQTLKTALLPLAKLGSKSGATTKLIERLGSERVDGINSIDQLRKALGAQVGPVSPKKLPSAASTSYQPSTQYGAQDSNKKAAIIGTLLGVLLVAGLIFGGLKLLEKPPEVREFNEFVRIDGGTFIYQDGERVNLKEFWMAKHEVTIGQYAEFIEWSKAEPDALAKLQHPEQPKYKTSHEPINWPAMYRAASNGKKFQGAKIDLNYPISNVDWWDAYAYARYKNARLPTEREWEKAGRGKNGSTYPWGSKLDTSAFNSGIDQRKDGTIDNYQFWAPVDGIVTDVSNFGVVGMAGNVSEWTSSWDKDSKGEDVPVKRGASFGTPKDFELSVRRISKPSDRNSYTGIRIVSDIEPGTDDSYRPEPPKSIKSAVAGEGMASNEQADVPKPKPAPAFTWDPADGDDPFKSPFAVPAE